MILFFSFFIIAIIILFSVRPSEVIDDWHHYFDELQFSSGEYYQLVQEGIQKRQVPDQQTFPKNLFETNVMSAKREYLRVTNVRYIFDICAAPYGSGFFVSWWLRESKSMGEIILNRIFPFTAKKTYYQLDTRMMFRGAIHTAVLKAIDEVTTGKGIRGLTELEKQFSTNPKYQFQAKP